MDFWDASHAHEQYHPKLIINLNDVESLSSLSLGMLLNLRQRLPNDTIKLVNCPASIRNHLKETHVINKFEIT